MKLFFRWLDRSLESIMIMREDNSIKFVSNRRAKSDLSVPVRRVEIALTKDTTPSVEEKNLLKAEQDKEQSKLAESVRWTYRDVGLACDEIKLSNISLVSFTALSLTLQCLRCKTNTDVEVNCNGYLLVKSCGRCNQSLSLQCTSGKYCLNCWFKVLAHENELRLAVLNVSECIPVFLIQGMGQLTCGVCLPDDPATTTNIRIAQIKPATTYTYSCKHCHAKMSIVIPAIDWRYRDHAPTVYGRGAKKEKQLFKFTIGEPLLDNGTCKHYKKSFRWFRFPCCGKSKM